MQRQEDLSPKVRAFVDGLINLSRQNFPIDKVTDFLKTKSIPLTDLESYIYLNERKYTRNLIYKSSKFELILLCWSGQQSSPIHGHEGEKCWMRVEEGVLHFDNYEEKIQGQLTKISSKEGSAGFVDGPAVIHGVSNHNKLRAVSLHLYARPFMQCDVYHPAQKSKEKKQLSYDSMYGKLL